MNNTGHILLVEDEPKLAQLLSDYLKQSNYQVTIIDDGSQVINWVKQHQPDAILLDLMLPNVDGMSICRQIRQFSEVPILMVTAKVEEIDRLLGLELGADDYICKPYSPREVVARVKAVLKRTQTPSLQGSPANTLILDSSCYQAKYASQSTELTAIEFELLQLLLKHPGQIFNREQLMRNCYQDNRIVSSRTIDSHIKKLRQKLTFLSEHHEFIHSVYGVGYKLMLDT